MTQFRKTLFSLFGLFFIAAAPLVYAQDVPDSDGGQQKGHFAKHIQEIYAQLNLTDDQKAKLEANKQQHRSLMQQSRQEMKSSKEALQEELMRPQLNMDRINKLHSRIKALLSQEEDNKLNSILAVRSILTADQFDKFVSLMHKHKQEHGE